MEILLIGICVIIAYFILNIIINPVDGCLIAILGAIKYVGIAMIVIGAVLWITSDDNELPAPSPVPSQLITNGDDEEDKMEVEPSQSYVEDEMPSPNLNTDPTPDYPISTYSPSNDVESTHRYPCRACKQSGNCPVCDGSGQTKTRLIRDSELGVLDTEYETCETCGGSGLCFSCKGDGWLDEADF